MTAVIEPDQLPRWDTTLLHPSPGDRSAVAAVEEVAAGAARLEALYDRHGVGRAEPHAPSADEVAAFDEVLEATNRLEDQLGAIRAFAHAHVSVDSGDADAQARASELEQTGAVMRQLGARFTAWVAALGADALAAASPLAADHAGPLRRIEVRATHQMSPGEESLYAALSSTGSSAWARLHGDLTSQLSAPVELPGGTRTLPMTAVRNLANDPDPAVREAGFRAELAAWPAMGVPLAAAMNAIKGEADVVNQRRGWADALAASRYGNAVSDATFDAMQAAVDESLPDFRRWMRAKARLHGHAGALPWRDLFAPCPVSPSAVSWDEGTRRVLDVFGGYSPALGATALRAFDERWVDVPSVPGKRGGAFCMRFVGDRSLVLLNWAGSADAVQTLAHELGHAYHNVQLAARTALQRQLPMALAETASIFCETLVIDAGLRSAQGAERLALLDVDLVGSNQVVVDIRSRLLFEREVFARRRRRALSPGELCELMVDAQTRAYGDGLDPDTRHPWMWAVKPHYYSSHFYNWPYTFGLLFGLGLFAEYRRDPERFRSGYDDLLSRAGMNTAEELGGGFGVDVTDVAFWRSSLDTVRERIDEHERLVDSLAGSGPAGSGPGGAGSVDA